MSEHLEIEFKTLVSPQDFKRLIDHFAIQKTDFFTQTNHYFDTDDFQLKAQRMGLRIRVLADRGELTLKVPAPEGLLEINDPLSLETANHFIKRNHLPTEGAVAKKLQELGIEIASIHLIGSLKTARAEKQIPQGLLALDGSWYNQQHDFELELEVTEAESGKQAFQTLMADLNIPITLAPNKIQRMMRTTAP